MAPTRPLSELQVRVLLAMARLEVTRWPNTPNEIGLAAGAKTIRGGGRSAGRGRGSGGQAHRVFGPAQQIIFPLNGLRKRGLVNFTRRRDGLSGTGYYLTEAGWAAAREERDRA